MKTLPLGAAVMLTLSAASIWLLDRSWVTAAGDTLPLLALFPAMFWLGRPWCWRAIPRRPPTGLAVSACIASLAGILTASILLLTIAWNLLAATWAIALLEPAPGQPRGRLLILGMLAFPWITLEAQPIGQFFRLTGASAACFIFDAIGFAVERQGTLFTVEKLPVSVDAACAGLTVLQAMLIVGAITTLSRIKGRLRFTTALLLLPLFAWLANTTRIIVTAVIALSFGPEAADGSLHVASGLIALAVMFLICLAVLPLLAERPAAPGKASANG